MWEGTGNRGVSDKGIRAWVARAGNGGIRLNLWAQIPVVTKVLLAVLAGLVVLFLFLILIRTDVLSERRASLMNSAERVGAGATIIPAPPPQAPAVVGSEDTKVFNGPSEDQEVIAFLVKGQRAEAIGASRDGTWWVIRLPTAKNGMGWVLNDTVSSEYSQGIAGMGGKPYLFALQTLEIRTGPGHQYEALGYLEAGQGAEVIGTSADNQWWVIKMPFFESGHGWVNGDRVEVGNAEGVAVVTPIDEPISPKTNEQQYPTVRAISNVNIRSGPGMEFKKIGLVREGQIVEAVGIDSGRFWLAIKAPGIDDDQGWVSVDYIVPEELGSLSGLPVLERRSAGGLSSVPAPEPGAPMLTAIYNVNIRSGPGTQHQILGKLVQAQQAEVVGMSADGLWWVIRIKGGENGKGWVAAAYVQAENTKGIPILK